MQKLVTDAVTAASTARQIAADTKQVGIVQALIKDAPALIPQVQQDIKDVRAALPVIKAGYATTEFWVVAASVAIIGFYPVVTGKPLAVDITVPLTGLAAVYTFARSLVKVKAPTPTTK